jgi:ketosteroid isomerase-like protein
MEPKTAPDLARAAYFAYEVKDRSLIEPLLSEDFTFSSPLDDNIGRQAYFERCWPNAENHRAFRIERCFSEGSEAFVTYTCERTDGAKFRNTEFFKTDGFRIRHVDVYFGRDTAAAVAETAVRAIVDATVQAIREKDAAALLTHYAENVRAFDLLVPLQYAGVDALRERVQAWLSSFEGSLEYDLHELRIAASDGTAFAHSLNHVRGSQSSGPVDMWWRATLGLEKIDETWRITHAHSSVPFEMETGKAAVGLRP